MGRCWNKSSIARSSNDKGNKTEIRDTQGETQTKLYRNEASILFSAPRNQTVPPYLLSMHFFVFRFRISSRISILSQPSLHNNAKKFQYWTF